MPIAQRLGYYLLLIVFNYEFCKMVCLLFAHLCFAEISLKEGIN